MEGNYALSQKKMADIRELLPRSLQNNCAGEPRKGLLHARSGRGNAYFKAEYMQICHLHTSHDRSCKKPRHCFPRKTMARPIKLGSIAAYSKINLPTLGRLPAVVIL
jgi:hypothetical protein